MRAKVCGKKGREARRVEVKKTSNELPWRVEWFQPGLEQPPSMKSIRVSQWIIKLQNQQIPYFIRPSQKPLFLLLFLQFNSCHPGIFFLKSSASCNLTLTHLSSTSCCRLQSSPGVPKLTALLSHTFALSLATSPACHWIKSAGPSLSYVRQLAKNELK